MQPRHPRLIALGLIGAFGLLAVSASASAQPVTVTAADPPSGERDTSGLVVRITGRNFAPGAVAEFFRSKTTDPGGITVRSVQFVSSTALDAEIDIADTAELSLFDIRVTNLSGRSGKGSDLFQVVEKGARVACVVPESPAWLGPAVALNDVVDGQPRHAGRMGDDVAAAADHSADTPTIIVAANAGGAVVVAEMRRLDDALVIVSRHTLATPGMTPRSLALGDINGDFTPDVVAGDRVSGRVVYFLAARGGDGLHYAPGVPLSPATDSVQFGADVSVAGPLVAVAQWGVTSGKNRRPGAIHLYRWSADVSQAGLVNERVLVPALSPALRNDDGFGTTVRLADVTGDGSVDVVAGAGGREVNGLTDAGEVFVFSGPSFTSPVQVIRAAAPAAGDHFGVTLGTGAMTAADDLVAGTLWTSANIRAEVRRLAAPTPGLVYTARPAAGLGGRFGDPGFEIGLLDADGLPDLLAPAPDAPCGGAVHVYLAPGSGSESYLVLQRVPDANYTGFGSSVAAAADGALRVLVIGEKGRTVGGVDDAGQVYVHLLSEQ